MRISAALRAIVRFSWCLLLSGCPSPAPHVLVTVADEDHVADNATEIAYAFSADGELTHIPLEGKSLPVTFVLEAETDKTLSLWVYAYDANEEATARGQTKAIFAQGSAGTARVELAGICGYGHPDGTSCISQTDPVAAGLCVEQVCVASSECGDGQPDEGEECDDGNLDDNDACSTTCNAARCGDGEVWIGEEECDLGDERNDDTQSCKSDCTNQVCGDGFRGPGEQCDEGNADTADCDFDDGVSVHACSFQQCGDGYTNAMAGETCDDGPTDSGQCDFAGGLEPEACTDAECGDEYLNRAAGEECDEGPFDTDGCDYVDGVGEQACTFAQCGDGYENSASNEDCDDGPADSPSCNFAGGFRVQSCKWSECGDSWRNISAGEDCDDGEVNSRFCDYEGAGPNACTAAECGDGYWNEAAEEECDDGPVDTGACDYAAGHSAHRCTLVECGDGYANTVAGEDCDTGPFDSQTCDFATGSGPQACTPALCGDGHLNPVAGEQCDDANANTGDDCPDGPNGSCRWAECGDGFVWSVDGTEECDDGRADSLTCDFAGGGSVESCTAQMCGDGHRNAHFELCDDGNTVWDDDCHSLCVPTLINPAVLNLNTVPESGDDEDPQVATDGAGNWIAVWESDEDLGGIGTDPDILTVRSTDGGVTWTPPAALNANARTDSDHDKNPYIATDGGGTWIAVWRIGYDMDQYFIRSTDNGATWTAPAALNTNAGTDSGDDDFARIAADGAGNWVAVWQSNDETGGIGTDYDVLTARSTDGGATWTAPAALNNNAGTDSGDDSYPQLATDGAGNWVAIWQSTDDFGGIGTDADILTARSTDNGATWTAPAVLNTNAAVDGSHDWNPRAATDGAGNWVVVWQSPEDIGGIGTDADILTARSTDDGATWTAPAALNSNAAADSEVDFFPQVATDGAGNWVTVWQSYEDIGGGIGADSDILTARSTDDGATWTAPAALNTNAATDDTAGDSCPQLTSDGAGNWIATWMFRGPTSNDNDLLRARSSDNGATWTAPAALNINGTIDSQPDNVPHLATDGAGIWIAAWQSMEDLAGIGSEHDILFARSGDDGASWTIPAPLNTNAQTDSGQDYAVQIATDGGGNWVAAWEATGTSGGLGFDRDILTARSTDGGITWTAPAALNAYAGSDSGDDWLPQIVTDNVGTWLAVWDSQTDLAGIGSDLDILFARSMDNGATWTAPVALNTNAGTDVDSDRSAGVTTDGTGNWVAVWESSTDLGGTSGSDYDILTARSTDNGITWTAPAALNANAGTDTGSDRGPQIATDKQGNWVVLWKSYEDLGGIGTDSDLLTARSTDNGATWTAPAVLNANAWSDGVHDLYPRIAADGAGSWIVVWESDDDLGGIGSDVDILVARSTDDGASWTFPAALNANAKIDTGNDQYPHLATDAAGHWVGAWASTEDLGGDIETDRDILFTYFTVPMP